MADQIVGLKPQLEPYPFRVRSKPSFEVVICDWVWFKGEYRKFVNTLYIMIISTRKLAYEANFNERVLVIQKNKLTEFKSNIKSLIKEIKKYEWNSLSNEKIQNYLNLYKLNIEDFKTNYTEKGFHLSN